MNWSLKHELRRMARKLQRKRPLSPQQRVEVSLGDVAERKEYMEPHKPQRPLTAKYPKATRKPMVNKTKAPEASVAPVKGLTPQEVSVKLNKSLNALDHMRRAKKGPAYFKEGNKVLYDPKSVEEYIKAL